MATNIEVKVSQDFINLKAQTLPPATTAEGIIFLNELDNKPKFREPNNGLVYDLTLKRYIGKDCIYQAADDTNGLFYWIQSDYGAQPWTYYEAGIPTVGIEQSTFLPNSEYGFYPDLYSRKPSIVSTDDLQFSNFTVLLNFPEKFYPSGIYLKSPNIDTYGFIQNYKIFMSNPDSEALVAEYEFTNSNDLVGVNSFKYIPFPNVNQYCTRLVIQQTGLNSLGTNHLALGQIELYGKLI